MLELGVRRGLALGAGLFLAVCGWVVGCATGVEFESEDDGGAGGQGAAATSTSAGGSGGTTNPCGIDCSTISTPVCKVATCNVGTGQCEVVDDVDGAACDDGVFCTVDDSCQAGTCTGGPENDCGLTPAQCMEVTCDETSQSCTQVASANGAPCQDPNNKCQQGMTCSNGQCLGGTFNDCFFFPVSDDCHVAVCDPADGMCKEQVGNEGGPCTDVMDLCTVSKTCAAGVCQGGSPKNCSQLTQGCVLGVCDPNNGNCTTQNLVNGDPCDDLNPCSSGETCNNGSCTGGSPVTACVNGDGCCPMNCNETNDQECAIPMGTARLVNGNFVNVQYHPCGGTGAPGTCTAAAAKQTCNSLGLKVVSHASNGNSQVLSLGATSSCYWSISYFTVNQQMPPGSCLVGISNLDWTSCCGTISWHGNTIDFGTANTTFGYVSTNDTGYVSTNPNVSGTTWGCNSVSSAASNKVGCTTQYVACTP